MSEQQEQERLAAPDGSGRCCIELLECGVWDTLDLADDEENALMLASHYAEIYGDDRIRVSTSDHEIL